MAINELTSCFTKFQQSVVNIPLPEKFTFPFYYQPHQLAQIACDELQQKLEYFHPLESERSGRMYGVLVVKDQQNNVGYLSALSGNNNDTGCIETHGIAFVPSIFEGFDDDSEYHRKHQIVNRLNIEIAEAEQATTYIAMQQLAMSEQQASEFQITYLQKKLVENRRKRKEKRNRLSQATATGEVSDAQAKQISIQLSRESVLDKKNLVALKAYWQTRTQKVNEQLKASNQQIAQLKKTRSKLSAKLQSMLFDQYHLLNISGATKSLPSIFEDSITHKPPTGAGDCAAPKLLQYAFKQKLTPICMAEFWWGNQPSSEIRKHGHFYPACQGKCQPILGHMLEGINVDDNPLLINPAAKKQLEVIHQDEHFVVINKPAGMLSVPGKTIQDSAYSRVKAIFPEATGKLVLHRLDMATSGLLVMALSARAHKHLQKQFINKVIQKRYIAIVDGLVEKQEGEINLPLILDINDRPRQMVCAEHGKNAKTKWQIIDQKSGKTRLFLYPITGRTHQLRVHCSHPDGLNMPIIGDSLYGTKANRLQLHAQQLSFLHPITQQRLTFEAEPDF